jgi:hypothetical protein
MIPTNQDTPPNQNGSIGSTGNMKHSTQLNTSTSNSLNNTKTKEKLENTKANKNLS